MKLYFIVVLIFISQMTDEIKYLFMSSFTTIFSFKNSMVLDLIFRSMIYFKLIFVYDLWSKNLPSFFCLWSSVFSASFVDKTILSIKEWFGALFEN